MKYNYARVHMKSGFNVSIQARSSSYCTPREDTGPYTHVELGYPSADDELIHEYAEDPDDPCGTVYGWVPAGLVTALLMKHGGIVAGKCPPLDMDTEQNFILAKALEGFNFDS